jgi:hypothetical protein
MTLIILIGIGLLGLVAHWLKKWARGQTKADFVEYMSKHRRHSIASVSTLLASVITMYTAGDVALSSQSAAMAFTAGYMIDSTLNKSPEDK